jgi:parallel beta-helix repeat protein
LLKGEVEHGISRSVYCDGIVTILFPLDSYRYEVIGTDTGTYGLAISSLEDGDAISFTATDIPTTVGAIHQYTIDWAALSQGEKGVTVKMDSDGDGVFEKKVIADNKLSQEELTPTLPVHNTNTGKSFSSIQAAVDAASAGDTIIVRDGTYTENVDIDKSITLKSSSGNPEYTIVDAVDPYDHVFSVTANHVEISGFTVTEAPAYGIYLHNADYCDISDNICSHSAFGIYLDGSNSNSISDNTCFNNEWSGISLSDSENNTISNNTCSNNDLGIVPCCSNNNRIYLNNFINNTFNACSEGSANIWNSKEKITYSYNGKSHTNYLGNYWSDYTGTDANNNGAIVLTVSMIMVAI